MQATGSADISGFRALVLLGPAADFNGCVPPHEVDCDLDYTPEAEERRAETTGMTEE